MLTVGSGLQRESTAADSERSLLGRPLPVLEFSILCGIPSRTGDSLHRKSCECSFSVASGGFSSLFFFFFGKLLCDACITLSGHTFCYIDLSNRLLIWSMKGFLYFLSVLKLPSRRRNDHLYTSRAY